MKIFQLFRNVLYRTSRYEVNKITVSTVSKLVETSNEQEHKQPSSRCRHVVAVIGFAVFFFLNVHRMNMTVSIVAMVDSPQLNVSHNTNLQTYPMSTGNMTEYFEKKRKGEFDWSPELQGYILGSGFIGYFTTQFMAGKLSEIFGCKWIIFLGLFIASAATLVTPFVSWWNVYLLVVVQALRGMAQGFYQPSISVLTSNWFPVMERGTLFAFMMSGNGAGALVGGLASGYLCDVELLGWPFVFYSCGAAGLIVSVIIAVFLYENPAVHPKISETEAKYILNNQESKLSNRRSKTPWRYIFTSVPIYALAFAFFGQNWAGSYFLSVHPTFLGTILKIPIAQNGLFTSVPFLLQTVFTLTASWVSNILNRNDYVRIDKVRKFWNFMSCFGYSACLIGIYFAEYNGVMNISFSFLAMAFIGFGYAGCMIVPADMTPTFAGSVMGIVSTFGTTAGFLLPLLVGFLTNGMQTLQQWNKIMFISIGVVMTSGVTFCIFGSANVQSWNYAVEEVPKDFQKGQDRF